MSKKPLFKGHQSVWARGQVSFSWGCFKGVCCRKAFLVSWAWSDGMWGQWELIGEWVHYLWSHWDSPMHAWAHSIHLRPCWGCPMAYGLKEPWRCVVCSPWPKGDSLRAGGTAGSFCLFFCFQCEVGPGRVHGSLEIKQLNLALNSVFLSPPPKHQDYRQVLPCL